MKIEDFKKFKVENKNISMITAYDYSFAKIINKSNIDCVLVGDSLSMVIHGNDSTLAATPEMMAMHTQAVAKGAPDKFIVGDMPFLSFRKGIAPAMDCVEKLMRAGANCVKLEGVTGHEEVISHIVNSDVPVMGHLGLTPQSIHKFGGYKVQGRDKVAANSLYEQARKLQDLGCFAVVLECIPEQIAEEITGSLSIPTIGIGAGKKTNGQVLVLQDMLGMFNDISPKFVKHYLNGHELIGNAINTFDSEIKNGIYPNETESYR